MREFFFFDCIGNVEAFEKLQCAIYSSIMLGISLISMSVEELIIITVICHREIYLGIFSANRDIFSILSPEKKVFKNKPHSNVFLF